MNRMALFLIAIIATIIIAFVFLMMVPYLSAVEEREGARPREGITIVHSSNINLRMEYYFVTTRDPNLIGVRISIDPIVNTIKPTIVGMYFPYHIQLNKTFDSAHTDYADWYESPNEYEHGTAFVWNVPCRDSDDCILNKNHEVEFILEPSLKFDSKDAYRHGIKIKFDNTHGISSNFFNKFEKPENLSTGVEYAKIQATIIIPENAQQIHTIPIPQPDMFHNMGIDYSNTQLDWNVTKDSRTFFVDYEMPNEHINFEEKQYHFTAISLFVGLVTGGLGIAVAIFYGKSDNGDSSPVNDQTSASLFKKDIGIETALNEQAKIRLIERKYLAIICVIIPIIVFVSIYLNSYAHEISNNVTLVVEVGVGFIMAVVIYAISRRSEIDIENKVSGVFDILRERENFRKKQVSSTEDLLLNVLYNMDTVAMQVTYSAESYESSENASQKEFYKQQVISGYKLIKNQAEENLGNPSIISSEFFDMSTIGKFKTLLATCKNEPNFSNDGKSVDVSFCNIIKKLIKPLIDEFNQRVTDRIESAPLLPVELEANVDGFTMSTSSDRTVYPLDSTIHVQANLPHLINDEKIIFEVFNSKRKLLLSQQVDPTTFDHPSLKGTNIFEASFKMEGNEWKVGERYIVRAKYASFYSEDSFIIDERMPALQSDKSVYPINSDIIITIIDPDADKDNDVAEFAGDREDSKLIIQSPYGKINGYKLRETGDSTGIFQGIIGVLGIREDGSVIERVVDGKIINKIQGTGIDDGFIGARRGEEITAIYKNNTGISYLTMSVSNFGASVEMDKKAYTPGDKVFLTIVAPDFNLDSNLIDEIGQKPESIVRIRTSKDELSNYKLVETGVDTGIFTGELYLVESHVESSNRSQIESGPNNGRLACNKDDFIEVIFSFFGSEQVVGSALIKSES